jgi:AcrR family transcriptional regulator
MTADSADVAAAPKRRNRVHRATSEELVQAAIKVIAREGVAAATTRKIAQEAGVPLGTVHYWFSDKNDLFEDVIREVVDRLEKAVAGRDLAPTGTSADVSSGLRAAWAQIAEDDPGAQLGMYELTALAVRTPAMRGLARMQYASYRGLVARALEQAAPGLGDRREALLAELISATFDGLCLAWLADPEGTHPLDVLDLLAELLGHMLSADPAHDGGNTPPKSAAQG